MPSRSLSYIKTEQGERDGASCARLMSHIQSAVYLIANENAIPFYEKLGMKLAGDVMEYNKIEWTEFTVK